MRKLKLQSQVTANGYIARVNGEQDWMTWNWDDDLKEYAGMVHHDVDTILLGRKMSEDFLPYWNEVYDNKPQDEEYEFSKIMVETPKVIFSKKLEKTDWKNTTVANGDLVEEVTKLKSRQGKDIIVYGGSKFVTNLIKENLIDEYILFVNPVAIDNGLTIFSQVGNQLKLELIESKSFKSGIVVLRYKPVSA